MEQSQTTNGTLSPRNDFVLLEEARAEAYHTYRGMEHIIVLPAYEHGPEDRPVMGRIVAKGESCVQVTIPIGAVAIAGKWTGARFPYQGKTYVLLKESDILAVLE